MKRIHAAAAIAALAFAGLSFAQAPGGTGQRGSTGPGMSQDGSRPADGAITGGSIAPGETGGVPDNSKGATMPSERATNRCNDLSGTLREQCLLQERGASTGGRSAPGPAQPPTPREAPPPQNPR
jgi:hypothetical protein